ncbi:MAG: FtsW/RodA/SpoVE family cell cycle protein [bacterium]
MFENTFKFDSTLFIVVVVLLVLGVVMVYSASSFKALETHKDSRYFLTSHFYKVLFGFFLMLIVSRIDYHLWLKISPGLLFLTLLALIYLVVAPGVEAIRGSKRWLTIGAFQVQPSDFARIGLILFLSATLGRQLFIHQNAENRFFLNLGIIGVMVFPLFFQPDVGTATLIILIALTLIFIAGDKLRYLFLLCFTIFPAFLMMLSQNSYQKQRVLQYLASLKGEDVSWQIQQSLIALGNGSFWGLGLGSGRQKYHFLPDPFTDFIYAIIGEELGLVGTLAILLLFSILIWRGFKLSMQMPEPAGKLLGVGIVLNIAIYAIANAGVVVNLLPTTGLPMPFLSYGGSALIVNLFGMGILLNITLQLRERSRLYRKKNRYQSNHPSGGYGQLRRH